MKLSDEAADALDRLERYMLLLEKMEVGEKLCLDFSLAANRKYYNGIVFSGFVDGLPSSVLKGGGYDRLAEDMGVNKGAIGFAVYLDEIERLEE